VVAVNVGLEDTAHLRLDVARVGALSRRLGAGNVLESGRQIYQRHAAGK
jgi:hypothetical protein